MKIRPSTVRSTSRSSGTQRRAALLCALTAACAPNRNTLGRVVVYQSGVAYYERVATPRDEAVQVSVPRDHVDDFLKSLTVRSKRTGESIAASFERRTQQGESVTMRLQVPSGTGDIVMTYIAASPAWKPSYRVTVADNGKVQLEGWAVVDNVSGEDWKNVEVGVGSSAAMSFKYDLWGVRDVTRESLGSEQRIALAPPEAVSPHRSGAQAVAAGPTHERTYDVAAAAGTTIALGSEAGSQSDSYGASISGSTSFENDYVVNGVNTSTGSRSGQAAPRDPLRDVANAVVAELRDNLQLATLAVAGECAAKRETADRIRNRVIDSGISPRRVVVQCAADAADQGHGYELRLADAAPTGAGTPGTAAIGESLFVATKPVTLNKDTSTMIAVLREETAGRIAYLYDPDSARGDASFAFRAVRLQNPTESLLERGPVTFYGQGRFIGEGIAEPIAAGAQVVIPFAMDRQIVVEPAHKKELVITGLGALSKSGVVAQVARQNALSWTVTNRSSEATVVYVSHPVTEGETLDVDGGLAVETAAHAHLIAVPVAAGAVVTATARQHFTFDWFYEFAQRDTMRLLRDYLATAKATPAERTRFAALLKQAAAIDTLHDELASLAERRLVISEREAELRAQLDSLGKRSSSKALRSELANRLAQVSRKGEDLAIAEVRVHERSLAAKIAFAEIAVDVAAPPASGLAQVGAP